MGMHEYREVIERFCDEADIEQVERILHEGLLYLDDTPAVLEYLEEQEACRIALDLGKPDGPGAQAVYSLLLEWNFRNVQLHAPVMGLEPDSGHIVLALVLPLAMLEEVGLMEVLDDEVAPLLEAWEDLREELGRGGSKGETAPRQKGPSSGNFV